MAKLQLGVLVLAAAALGCLGRPLPSQQGRQLLVCAAAIAAPPAAPSPIDTATRAVLDGFAQCTQLPLNESCDAVAAHLGEASGRRRKHIRAHLCAPPTARPLLGPNVKELASPAGLEPPLCWCPAGFRRLRRCDCSEQHRAAARCGASCMGATAGCGRGTSLPLLDLPNPERVPALVQLHRGAPRRLLGP